MDSKIDEIIGAALDAAARAGTDYADVRFVRNRKQVVNFEDDFIRSIEQEDMSGYGVRALVKGAWGFASSTDSDLGAVRQAARLAVDMAGANAAVSVSDPVTLTPDEPRTGSHETPMLEDPFEVPIKEKVSLLTAAGSEALRVPGVRKVLGWMNLLNVRKTFASTEGARVSTDVTQTAAEYTVWAVGNGLAKQRTYSILPLSAGYEHLRRGRIVEEAPRVAREAVEHLKAKPVPAGRKDLILMPSHLSLTIHESVGHATELDRALGMEESLAGRSFAVPSLLGKLKYGSDLVNFKADNAMPGGLATMGFDDDGVPGTSWHIVKDGVLRGYSTSREVAGKIGQTRSMGSNRADSWSSFPIVRIPNLSLEPGSRMLSLDDLIADTKDGILIDGKGSYSIDQMRCNFQFGGNAFFEIKNGRIGGMLRDVTYQAITTDFWNSCDAICDGRFFEPHGELNCGKGDPMQISRMTHGSAPARFRNISVGGIR